MESTISEIMSTEMNNAVEFFITTFAELAILFIIISFVVSIINVSISG